MKLRSADTVQEALGGLCPTPLLSVSNLEIFFGPNLLSSRPAVHCGLEVGANPPPPQELAARVRARLPEGLAPIGVELSDDQTATADLAARLAAAVAAGLLAKGMDMPHEHGSIAVDDTHATFWTELIIEQPAIQAVRIAVLILGSALAGTEISAERAHQELSAFDRICSRTKPNNESRVLIAAARRKDVPFLQICDYPSLWQFGWGERSERFWVTSSNGDGLVGGHLSRMKDQQKRLFRSLGLPTPAWRVLGPGARLEEAARTIGFPCVVKPVDRGSGKGVNADIRDMRVLRQAIAAARGFSQTLLIEAHETGDDHRLMVADGQLIMAVRRRPPTVVGDGKRSVGELMARLNEERRREAEGGGYLKQVPEDQGLHMALAGQHLTLDSVPAKGLEVRLRTNANHSTGGVVDNVIDRVHPQVRGLAEQLAQAAGFRVVGIDYITPDVRKSHDEVGGAFIEINATPGMEVVITEGMVPESVADLVLGTKPGRIPVRLVLADPETQQTIGPTLCARLPEGAGAVSGGWAQIGPLALPQLDLRVTERTRSLLRYPTLKALVIFWTPEELSRLGMPVDAVDEVIVVGPALPGGWDSVLKRHSARLVLASTADEALKRLERRPGATRQKTSR